MKNTYYLLFALLLAVACKKEKKVAVLPKGSIVLAPSAAVGQTVSGIYFSAQDSVTAVGLMQNNNLSTDGFVFYTYQSYNALDQNHQTALFQLPTAMQVRNGLPVFFYDITFAFENGKFIGPYPAPQFIAGNIALDNKPNLSLKVVRDAFVKLDNATEAYNISIGDSTLVAQLGYYNLNINKRPDGVAPDYIKAWYVHTRHYAWPEGYFRDDNGVAISFRPGTHSGPAIP